MRRDDQLLCPWLSTQLVVVLVLYYNFYLFLLVILGTPGTAEAAAMKNIVVVGAGIQGTSIAYFLSKNKSSPPTRITLLEAEQPASAASGKGGGFMARSWGDGGPTQDLHHLGFDLFESLAHELKLESYRKLPVLSVTPGYRNDGIALAKKNKELREILPDWLDGKSVGRISALGYGDDTAQVTPKEVVDKMLENAPDIQVTKGVCVGIETDQGPKNTRKVTAVRYIADGQDPSEPPQLIPADVCCISAGPWSCAASDWLPGTSFPMEGVKSTSIVWEKPQENANAVDATALFCGEHDTYHTHLEVYPRPNGEIYICGIGGSDYITTEQLKQGAFRGNCPPNSDRVDAAVASFREMSSVYENVNLAKTQACMRPCPPDALPYMGAIDGYTGCYINAGHNCWGIAWSPACGKAMAELILDGKCESVDLSPFDPGRFAPAKSTRGRKKGSMNVGEQW